MLFELPCGTFLTSGSLLFIVVLFVVVVVDVVTKANIFIRFPLLCNFPHVHFNSFNNLPPGICWSQHHDCYSLGFRKPLLVVAPAEACEQVCWCYLISFLSRHLGVFLTGCDERRADLTSSLYTLCLTTRQSQVVEPMKHSVAKITNWA